MTWDNSVHFGKGKLRGTGTTGFHTVNNTGTASSVFTGLLWRGDSRDTATIFAQGFQMHQAGIQVHGRTTSNVTGISDMGTTRGGISMSKSINGAGMWAADGDWLYMIYLEDNPWVAEIAWNAASISDQALSEANRQLEFMALNVPPTAIVGGRRLSVNTAGISFNGDAVMNPAYAGTRVAALPDWAVQKFVTPGNVTIMNAALIPELNAYEAAL